MKLGRLREQAGEWIDLVVGRAVREEMERSRALQADRENARERLAIERGKLPAGVFLVPPPTPEAEAEAFDAPPTTTGKTVIVGLDGGEVDIELDVYRPVPRGAVLFAWGPVNLSRVYVGPSSIVAGGAAFAVLPALHVGYRIQVVLSVWVRR